MTQKKSSPPKAAKPKLTPWQLHRYELAGGMEGGMPAGDAGGPGEAEMQKRAKPADPDEN